jgi:hypothetical protein
LFENLINETSACPVSTEYARLLIENSNREAISLYDFIMTYYPN